MWADGFRVFFTPLLEVLFTFPSRYWFAIGLKGVFSLAGWSPRIRAEFLVLRATQGHAWRCSACRYGAFTLYGPAFQPGSRSPHNAVMAALLPRLRLDAAGLGCSAFARRYLRNHMLFSLPAGTKMFQFPAFAHLYGVSRLHRDGLPHSDTPGSGAVCASPGIFAAYRVLHRLLEPRHPPSALTCFSFYL